MVAANSVRACRFGMPRSYSVYAAKVARARDLYGEGVCECGAAFVRMGANQRFCCETCGHRASEKRKQQRNTVRVPHDFEISNDKSCFPAECVFSTTPAETPCRESKA